jgi:SAM-dependent methyltransferase
MSVFDKYASNYDEGHTKAVKLSGFSPSYFDEYKIIILSKIADKFGDKELTILNYGCGTGKTEKYIKKYIPKAKICSIDVSEKSINTAKKVNSEYPDISFMYFDGKKIPTANKYDIIFCANVFHHIRREDHQNALNEIYEKLNSDGLFVIFELNPLNPMTMLVAIQNDYKFDPDANLLTPSYLNKMLNKSRFSPHSIYYSIFFPSFLSALIPFEKYLSWLPLGAHYYYVANKCTDISCSY